MKSSAFNNDNAPIATPTLSPSEICSMNAKCVGRGCVCRSFRSASRARNRNGLSLLEVMISLAILAMSSAMLWQITNQATNNARDAQRLTQAQILAESKMAEILAGAFPLEPIEWRLDESGAVPGNWYFKLQTSTAERENMIGLRLSVSDDPERTEGNPETFFIARYVIDPQLGLDTPQDPTLTDSASGTTNNSSTGASSGNASSSGGSQ